MSETVYCFTKEGIIDCAHRSRLYGAYSSWLLIHYFLVLQHRFMITDLFKKIQTRLQRSYYVVIGAELSIRGKPPLMKIVPSPSHNFCYTNNHYFFI